MSSRISRSWATRRRASRGLLVTSLVVVVGTSVALAAFDSSLAGAATPNGGVTAVIDCNQYTGTVTAPNGALDLTVSFSGLTPSTPYAIVYTTTPTGVTPGLAEIPVSDSAGNISENPDVQLGFAVAPGGAQITTGNHVGDTLNWSLQTTQVNTPGNPPNPTGVVVLSGSTVIGANPVCTIGGSTGGGGGTTAPPPPPSTFSETTGVFSNTWTNYTNAGGIGGPQIPAFTTIQITCKIQGFRVADGNTWWYLVASSPWNNQYYVSADPFYNNGATSGSLHGTPFVDPAVPDCTPSSGGGGTYGPAVTLAQGPAAPAGFRYAISLTNFPANSSVTIICRDSVDPNGFYTFALRANGSGAASTASYCYSGDGPDHWVTANGVVSNHVEWGPGSSGGGGTTGGGGTGGAGPGQPPADTVIQGIDVGRPVNSPHTWGTGCTVQDFGGGPHGHVIVGLSNGTQIVLNQWLQGWLANGGGPGLGCPDGAVYAYSNGYRQNFTNGSLYWTTGMTEAQKIPWIDTASSTWSGYEMTSTKVTTVQGIVQVPTLDCSGVSGVSYVGAWVGVDGDGGSKDLVQAGVLANCVGTKASYSLFWQKVPFGNGQSQIVGSVSPGDQVTAKVVYGMNNAYTITLAVNGVPRKTVTGTFAGGTHTTAECITEDPLQLNAQGHVIGSFPFAGFNSINFSSCQVATNSGTLFPIFAAPSHGASLYRIDLHVGGTLAGQLEATPSLPRNNTSGWSVIRK